MDAEWIGTVGTWLGSIGTTGAMFAALRQLRLERESRKEEESLRAKEQKRRDEEVKREQANKINSWIDPENESNALIVNDSNQPIYWVVIHLVISIGSGPQTSEAVSAMSGAYCPNANRYLRWMVPPGTYSMSLKHTWGGMVRKPGVEISFTDARGEHWVRRKDGTVEPLPHRPFEYFKVENPWGDFPIQPVK